MSPQSTVHRPQSAHAGSTIVHVSRFTDRVSRFTFHVSRNTEHEIGTAAPKPCLPFRNAFTLIEIMVVVGIMGLILLTGVPIVYKVLHRAPMAEALKGIQEVCSNARAQAIMQGKEVDVVFHPRDGRLEIGSAAAVPATNTPEQVPQANAANAVPAAAVQSGRATKFSDRIRIDMLDINQTKGHDFNQDEIAYVRFFPNGTSDELTIILSSDRGEQRGVVLEVTTGLATVLSEADLQNLRNGKL